MATVPGQMDVAKAESEKQMGLSVSIVIPAYNRAGLVCRAIGSALGQIRSGDEIIVVDDGSTDATDVRVRWPSGAVTEKTAVPIGQAVTIRQ